jgi:putative protease
VIYSLYKREEIEEVSHFFEKIESEPKVIVGFKDISRFWNWDFETCKEVARECVDKGMKVYLQWDILMTESTFQSTLAALKSREVLKKDNGFSGIRVQDSGALQTLLEMDYQGEIHFIAEQGNHNLTGLQSWLSLAPEKINRLVLSPELPAKTLKEYSEVLSCELEYLGFGPLLLFYTPRHLVKPLYEGDEEDIRVSGTSEESPHKGFPIRDNLHGTFMFNTKDQFILDEDVVSELPKISFRVDFIEGRGELKLDNIHLKDSSLIKELYQRPLTKGFFRVNKTDVLFKKLKNKRLQDRNDTLLGEVVDVKKEKHIGLLITHPHDELFVGDTIEFLSPEGREKTLQVKYLKDASGNSQDSAKAGDIVFVSHLGGISIKSLAFKK